MHLLTQIHKAIQTEIRTQRQKLDKPDVQVEDIHLVRQAEHGYIYQLALARRVNLIADQPITLMQTGKSNQTIEGTVVHVQDYTILVFVTQQLNEETIRITKLSFDPTFILSNLEELLIEEKWLEAPFVQMLLDGNLPKLSISIRNIDIPDFFNPRQVEAIRRSLSDPIHIIWGPPGTGKTKTMGQIIVQQLKRPRSCLLLSVSNVAVDQLLKAVIEQNGSKEPEDIIRIGIPTVPALEIYTPRRRVLAKNPELCRKFNTLLQQREQLHENVRKYIAETSKHRETSQLGKQLADQIAKSFLAIQEIESEIQEIERYLSKASEEVTQGSWCVATTLASLVVRRELHDIPFDSVFVDEISMLPLLFIFAAARMAFQSLTLAGDPKQLPPIYMDKSPLTQKWLGHNVYDHLGINSPNTHSNVTFLNEQYRMQKSIADVVGISYGDQLRPNPKPQKGSNISFFLFDTNDEKYEYGSYYSIYEKSYYFPISTLVIATLAELEPTFHEMPTLLLTPFRAQEKLFSKLVQDLPFKCASSSTIHRSQGSESDAVILDLTIHETYAQQAFFEHADTAEKLLNVAISRTKQKLVILCNLEMLRILGNRDSYYQQLYKRLLQHVESSSYLRQEITKRLKLMNDWLPQIGTNKGGCFYASLPSDTDEYLHQVANTLKSLDDQSPVIVGRSNQGLRDLSSIIWRSDNVETVPPMALCGGDIFLRLNGFWVQHYLENTAKTLRYLAAGHLLGREMDIKYDGNRLICQNCGYGMELVRTKYALQMRCTNTECGKTRRVTYVDAQIISELHQARCPKCYTKMTPRQSKGEYFLGCMNYPSCKGTRALSEFALL